MNKIFKVVWSKTKGCFVVASELAKSHQGGTRRVKRISVALMVALILAPQMITYAYNYINVGGAMELKINPVQIGKLEVMAMGD